MRSHMAIIASRERAKALRPCLVPLHQTLTTYHMPAAGPNARGAAFLSTAHLTKCYDKPCFLLPISGRTLYPRVKSPLHCAQPSPYPILPEGDPPSCWNCDLAGHQSSQWEGGRGQWLNEHLSISVPINVTFVATVRIKKWRSPWVKWLVKIKVGAPPAGTCLVETRVSPQSPYPIPPSPHDVTFKRIKMF